VPGIGWALGFKAVRRNKRRLGRQRRSKVARVNIARELSTAIWHLLLKREPFCPGRSHGTALVA
jgi:hypothetical protein